MTNQVTFPNPYVIGGISFSYQSVERVDTPEDDFSNFMFIGCYIITTNNPVKFPLGAYAPEIGILFEMTATLEVYNANGNPISGHGLIAQAKPF